MDHDKIIKDAQYRKGLSIAFFNATNAAVELVKVLPPDPTESALQKVVKIRDFFLDEHRQYYATVIANIGTNYTAEDSIKKLKASKNLEELNIVWRSFSADERHDEEIIRVAKEEKSKYVTKPPTKSKNEKA